MNFITNDLLISDWQKYLSEEFKKEYFKNLNNFLASQLERKKTIFPARKYLFNALNQTPLGLVKIVILGQDPYHQVGQAHGLSFSVPKGEKIPPSLKNIFQELYDDIALPTPLQGDLTSWAKEGVLLLNTVLTVEEGKAGAHHGKGWEQFTDEIMKIINHIKENVVFILWGANAQKKVNLIDQKRHQIIASAHPSPLSSYRGFFGSKPFSRANAYLSNHQIKPVSWIL